MFISAPPGPSRSLELLVTETGAEYGLAGWLGRPPTPGMVVRRGVQKTSKHADLGTRSRSRVEAETGRKQAKIGQIAFAKLGMMELVILHWFEKEEGRGASQQDEEPTVN